MDCNEARRLLEADTDGELDLVCHLSIEVHLQSCPACRQIAEGLHLRRATLRAALPRFEAPPALAAKIRQALPTTQPVLWRWPSFVWSHAGLAAALLVALLVGYGFGHRRGEAIHFADDAVASHVRSLMANHLTDVASTDQHTVKPWFTGKLDFSPPVVDLASAGFPLSGGRLDRLDGHSVAALVYHRRLHPINLFVWPADRGPVPQGGYERQGYHSFGWSQRDLNYFAISEISENELMEFVAKIRAELP
jgi:anti-sigma factor RsiW